MSFGGRGLTAVVATLVAVVLFALPADAAVRVGSVEDPADAPGRPDVAAASVRYDETGGIELSVRFHEPVTLEAEETADWSVSAAGPSGDCADTRQGLAGLLDLASGEAALTYGEVSENGEPVEREVPARQTLSADRRELVVAARADTLAQRPFSCSRLAVGIDEVASFALKQDPGPGPDGTAAPVASQPAGAPAAAVRVGRGRLSFLRRRRTRTAVLRLVVCAPAPAAVVVNVREARRRVDGGSFTPERRRRFTRTQRVRCQDHRVSWPVAGRPDQRYLVRARLTVLAVPTR